MTMLALYQSLTLVGNPVPAGGGFDVPDTDPDYPGWRYDGNWLEQYAKDADGKEYKVIWTDVDWDADGGDQADWDHPNYIIPC